MSGFELLNRLHADEAVHRCPVIVYTGQDLTEEQNVELTRYADSVIVKGVKSPERLLDETALFLHQVVADMPEEKRQTIKQLHDREAALEGKHVMVVDDDMRSAFALSRLLGDKGLKVTIARDGARALDLLDTVPGVDLVLMDIMMPEMDGYETIERIRAQYRFRSLPILALTAKAMKGDQDRCIAAGANDYLSKPVDADRLFSMLRVWLYR
jgi:tubulin-specific chaperone A